MSTKGTRGGVVDALRLTADEVTEIVQRRWSDWAGCCSVFDGVPDAQALRGWVAGAAHRDRDLVLRYLINQASVRGSDDDDAAKVVAWLMLGPACVLARRYGSLADVDLHIAAQLWLEIKQYDDRRRTGEVRSTEVWIHLTGRLRFYLSREFRQPRLVLVAPDQQAGWHESLRLTDVNPAAAARAELMDVLQRGVERGVISGQDRVLLLDVLAASGSVTESPRGGSLLGDRVSDVVGILHGVSGRTVRRRVQDSLNRLAASHREMRQTA